MRSRVRIYLAGMFGALLLLAGPVGANPGVSKNPYPNATIETSGTFLDVIPHVSYEKAVLRVVGPGKFALTKHFDPQDALTVDLLVEGQPPISHDGRDLNKMGSRNLGNADPLPDGHYRYEVTLWDAEQNKHYQSGSFFAQDGNLVSSDAVFPPLRSPKKSDEESSEAAAGVKSLTESDFITITDAATDNNTGLNMENSGFTGKSIRIIDGTMRFQVGSSSGTTPLVTIDASGQVGQNTATPAAELHPVVGDTPTLRLEQDSSGGFSAQTWEVAGNETSFFVRDATNGNTFPFRIRPGAPSSSIDIAGNGNIGIGTSNPLQPVHVQGSDGSTQLLVNDTNGTAASRTLFRIINKGPPIFRFVNQNASTEQNWEFTVSDAGEFLINATSTGKPFELRVQSGGDLIINGTLTEGSSRSIKEGIVDIDERTVLDKLSSLPVTEWSYVDNADERHIGPMAEDFHATFGLGQDNKHIAPKDLAGVALAAAKALKAKTSRLEAENQALKSEIKSKKERLTKMEARLDRLEAIMGDP